jgi:putative ABC transport system substrate-binding protein
MALETTSGLLWPAGAGAGWALQTHWNAPPIQVAEAGGLMAYDTDYPDLTRRAATYVDKILKGAEPSDLPVQQPTKFALVINLKTAKAPGLTLSKTFLFRADRLIE